VPERSARHDTLGQPEFLQRCGGAFATQPKPDTEVSTAEKEITMG